jgi:hypothetical protein
MIRGVAVVLPLLPYLVPIGVDFTAVEPGALVLVGEQVVGRTDLTEPGRRVRVVRIDVWMVLFRQLPIGDS